MDGVSPTAFSSQESRKLTRSDVSDAGVMVWQVRRVVLHFLCPK